MERKNCVKRRGQQQAMEVSGGTERRREGLRTQRASRHSVTLRLSPTRTLHSTQSHAVHTHSLYAISLFLSTILHLSLSSLLNSPSTHSTPHYSLSTLSLRPSTCDEPAPSAPGRHVCASGGEGGQTWMQCHSTVASTTLPS